MKCAICQQADHLISRQGGNEIPVSEKLIIPFLTIRTVSRQLRIHCILELLKVRICGDGNRTKAYWDHLVTTNRVKAMRWERESATQHAKIFVCMMAPPAHEPLRGCVTGLA